MGSSPELESHRDIKSWFIVKSIPKGEVPVAIRASWLGVPLPVRDIAPERLAGHDFLSGKTRLETHSGLYPLSVPVETADAIKALRLSSRHEAAEWWQMHLEEGVVSDRILFEANEGECFSLEEAQYQFPESQFFEL